MSACSVGVGTPSASGALICQPVDAQRRACPARPGLGSTAKRGLAGIRAHLCATGRNNLRLLRRRGLGLRARRGSFSSGRYCAWGQAAERGPSVRGLTELSGLPCPSCSRSPRDSTKQPRSWRLKADMISPCVDLDLGPRPTGAHPGHVVTHPCLPGSRLFRSTTGARPSAKTCFRGAGTSSQ